MPSHIFTRVGYWKESIGSNTTAARAAKADKEFTDQLHAMDYMVYAYLQLGQDAKARDVVEEMKTVTGVNPNVLAGPYALAASPARFMVERGDWKGAAELEVRPTSFAQVQAMTHFARALGAARTGNPEAAKAEVAKLAELRDKLRAAKDAYWSEQVDIQWQVANAWVLNAEGKTEEALKVISAAADAEDKIQRKRGEERIARCRTEPQDEMDGDAGEREHRDERDAASHLCRNAVVMCVRQWLVPESTAGRQRSRHPHSPTSPRAPSSPDIPPI